MRADRSFSAIGFLAPIFLLSACALFEAGTAPDDMSAEEHRRESDEHAEKAREHTSRYDPSTRIERDAGRLSDSGRWRQDYDYRDTEDHYWGGDSYNPSSRHLADARKHEALAAEHLESARYLERFEEAQCASFPPDTRAKCPLLGQMISIEEIPGGDRVRLAKDVDVDAAVAHMRCHIAFARSLGHSGMNSCPLYLDGVRVFRNGTGDEVDFLIGDGDAEELEALRKKLREHLLLEGQ